MIRSHMDMEYIVCQFYAYAILLATKYCNNIDISLQAISNE